MLKVKVWDGFIRSFYWLLVVVIVIFYFSVEEGMLELYFVVGYFILVLIIICFVWGFIGSKIVKFFVFIYLFVVVIKLFISNEYKVGYGVVGSYMVIVFFVLIFV